MKRKMFWGSVVVALLILVSSQIVFLNAVKSDPTRHTGDVDVGDLWISELDVSSNLATIDYIGISHANATDDWVYWQNGTGNINASWSVNIDRNHPEYYVNFSFIIINVDDNCNITGIDIFSKIYNADTDYDESGTLSVAIEFSEQQMEMGRQTLVCSLGAYVRINDTVEAVNLTCIAGDRCVIGVDFVDPPELPPFSTYVEYANDAFPSAWSWINGWESTSFTDENDMLNHQTYFQIGHDTAPLPGGDDIWYLGLLDIDIKGWTPEEIDISFTPDDKTADWKRNYPPEEEDPNWIVGTCWLNYSIDDMPFKDPSVTMRYTMSATEPDEWKTITEPKTCSRLWIDGFPRDDHIKGRIGALIDWDCDEDNYIMTKLDVWVLIDLKEAFHYEDYDYKIHNTSFGNNTAATGGLEYNWEEECAYVSNYSIGVTNQTSSGITTITVGISDILDESNEVILSFAADADDTRVEFTC